MKKEVPSLANHNPEKKKKDSMGGWHTGIQFIRKDPLLST